jgi:hypothetical protein
VGPKRYCRRMRAVVQSGLNRLSIGSDIHAGRPLPAPELQQERHFMASNQDSPMHEPSSIPTPPGIEREPSARTEMPTNGGGVKPKVVLIVIGAVLLSCVALAVVLTVTAAIPAFQTMNKEGDNIRGTIEKFMLAGERNDPQTAYGQFSTSAGSDVTPSSIEDLINNRRDRFEEYEAVKLQAYNINATSSGTIARVSGSIQYADHTPVPFTASLRRESDQWKLTGINFLEGVGR